MSADDREIDEEIRGHLALSIKDRIEQGEDPEAALRRLDGVRLPPGGPRPTHD
jgi:hypothetical protein